MRNEIQEKLSEIKELEFALRASKSNTVSYVLQEAIDIRQNEIDELKPNGVVLVDVLLKDGTELKQCLLFSVKDGIGSHALTDTYIAREMLTQEDEVYLQQVNEELGDFAGNIETSDIDEYSVSYTNENVK
ncbi:hypothetical protein P9173_09435 [Bacillus safensis]|uniref:hypothetical protein n=1 Tax=Bacillus safensis TaxID=561879 RepID=UPI00227FC49F|nr:hypothetical protein [Bacillus safensis]MCY7542476.1 hypothetical protein [Bacillus safensis]MCY7552351.1 hypothetical protein [Bacillus safensis]MCY7644782.1 hypothetical protein [Bacillus safensis]MCY7655903.1 hypothetical protein [Bacillus safensis]MEC3710377.1 hypothetical protein [Bacillus safensis]